MCGIAGIVQQQPSPDLSALVARMTQALHHRGPDDGGLVGFLPDGAASTASLGRPDEPVSFASGAPDATLAAFATFAALGARRLAIVDLSPRGHQPMSVDGGRAWIAFNGEIYNHAELRAELRAAGIEFQSGTDTEVALRAWLAWGPACFERFNGMWALAVYEPAPRRLTLSRDRFGIKPLHYLRLPEGLAFASEIRPLLLHPLARRRVNAARAVEFLCEGWVDHTDETLFEGIFSVPAGGRLTLEPQANGAWRVRIEQDQWRSAGDGMRGGSNDGKELRHSDSWPALLRDRLDAEVAAHLRGDVPAGSCLSGGIDSSGVVTTMHDLHRRSQAFSPNWSQHTFTAVLPGDPLDESRYADAVLEACPELQSHRVEPAADGLLDDLDQLIDAQEQPFGGPSIYMQWCVMRAARTAGLKVLLDGQGGDELFCGYPGFWPPYIAELIRRGSWREALRTARSAEARGQFSGAALLRRIAARLMPADLREMMRRRRWTSAASAAAPALLERAGMRAANPAALDHSAAQAFAEARGTNSGAADETTHRDDSFAAFWWDVLRRRSLPGLLRYEDRNSMAFSIEARVPLLGRGVADLAIAAPAAVKLAGGRTKAVLRDALRGRVPDAILARRDKIGFAAPTQRWMQGPLRPWWSEQVRHGAGGAWLNAKALTRMELRLDAGEQGAADGLWRAAILVAWLERFRVT